MDSCGFPPQSPFTRKKALIRHSKKDFPLEGGGPVGKQVRVARDLLDQENKDGRVAPLPPTQTLHKRLQRGIAWAICHKDLANGGLMALRDV